MLSKGICSIVLRIDPHPVEVDVDIANRGLPHDTRLQQRHKVVGTIADIEGSVLLVSDHVSEAVQHKSWGAN
jgi:predicted ATPase with chaperone activity